MMRAFSVCCMLLVLCSCESTKTSKTPTLNGVWESIGSGWILQIKDSTAYQFYDVTSISCLPRSAGPFKDIKGNLSLKNDTLSLLKGVIQYDFVKRDTLPYECQHVISDTKSKDPLYNFEVFAETIKEHYAFFERNHIQWESLYAAQKAKLTPAASDVALYKVLDETLERLNDNHAFLEATDAVYEKLSALSEPELDATDSIEEVPEYGDIQVANMVATHHLQEDLTRDYHLKFPLIQWGKLTDTIGYVQIKTMWLYADLEIPQSQIDAMGYVDAYVEAFHKLYEGTYIEKEVKAVAHIMDMVMHDLSAMGSIVLDVRFNGGGQDAVSFEILSRFISDKSLQVATQKLRFGDQHTSVLPLYIEGRTRAFSKPVYVLTSQQTGSAAEAFSIATMAMDQVKRIGEPTSGAMSTALEKTLPNGWNFAISNEVYMDNAGNSYENIGIPVDYKLNYPADRQTFFRSVVNDLERDKKQLLSAIAALEGS